MEGLQFHNPLDTGQATVEKQDDLQEVIDAFPVEEEVSQETNLTEPLVEELVEELEEDPQKPEVLEEFEESVTGIANYLSDNGLIKDVPADIDLESFEKDDLVKLVKHNVELEGVTKFNEGVEFANKKLSGKLDEFTHKIMTYNLDNPNADTSDIQSYIGSLMYSSDITKLTVEKDAEKIVREYYKSIDWEQDAIEKKIVQLTSLDDLAGEASILKPKLDVKASSIAASKLEAVNRIKEFEASLQANLNERVTTTLDTGKLNDIDLSQEQASFLYAAIMNNDTPVTIKGKKVEMGFAEALIRNAKYNPKSNMEDLMLGLLVIQEGKSAIEKFYKKKATTEVSEAFTRTHKFSNNKKKQSSVVEENKFNTGLKFKM